MKTLGTMVTVTQHCLKCNQTFEWNSQPLVHGKNSCCKFAVEFCHFNCWRSISKTLLNFRHMGLCVLSARTYFRHQRDFLFPSVLHYWETYRADLINKLKTLKDVVWTGDGRFDSMGHSAAKYGPYTMLCTSIMKIKQFEIVEV